MQIRNAEPGEAALLGRIAWEAKASWGYSHAQLEAWRSDLTPADESLRVRPTFVAEVDGEAVGFCQLVMQTSPAELEHLWVLPRFMRKGVGRALLEHAVRHLAQQGAGILAIDSDPNAEAFYVGCGAVRHGLRPAPAEGEPNRVRPQLRLSTSDLAPPSPERLETA